MNAVPEAPARGLAETIRAAQAGDEASFEALMEATQRKVAVLAHRMLGSADEARDVVQEVYLRVYRSLGSFRADENFHGWLYRITLNVCRDAARKRRRAVPLPENDAVLPPALVTPDASESAAFAAQRAALLARALATLPEKERRAIVLRDLEGLETREVARILGSSPITVRTQIWSGRKRLHAFLVRAAGRRP